jgi:hypothetical protein
MAPLHDLPSDFGEMISLEIRTSIPVETLAVGPDGVTVVRSVGVSSLPASTEFIQVAPLNGEMLTGFDIEGEYR